MNIRGLLMDLIYVYYYLLENKPVLTIFCTFKTSKLFKIIPLAKQKDLMKKNRMAEMFTPYKH